MTDPCGSAENINCPACGEANSRESEFCWACYKNLRIPQAERNGQPPAQSLKGTGQGPCTAPDQKNDTPSEDSGRAHKGPAASVGRLILTAGLFLFYLRWFQVENYFSPLDYINLAFHEAGHIFLGFLGEFVMTLGGTVFQLLAPAACGVHFLLRNNRLGWQLCMYWTGQNLLNISIYAGDAIRQELPLVGSGVHDWTYLLTQTHLIAHTTQVGRFIFITGSFVIFISLSTILWDAFQKPSAATGN